MKTFGIAIGCIVSINLILIVLFFVKIDVGDILFAILSGSVVAFLAALLALSKGMPSSKVMMLVFLSVLSAMGSWIIALLMLRIMTISLYSTTALAFDLTIGIIGSITMSAYFIEQEINKHVTKNIEPRID